MSPNMNDMITAHLRRCRGANLSERTITDRGELLERLDRDLPLGLVDATTEDLEDWLAQAGPVGTRGRCPWSAQTRGTYYTHIVGFFRDMAGRIGHDPSAGLMRPKVEAGLPRPATEDELQQALTLLAPPWDLYVMLAAYAGLRSCEVAALDRRHVNADELAVHQGKGGKSRIVETHPDLWRRMRAIPPGPIALLGSGRVMTAYQMSSRMAYRFDKIGMPDITMHRFRSRFATMLLRPKELGGAGADLLTVSILMGHANPNTTKIYALVTSEQRRLAVNALPAPAPC